MGHQDPTIKALQREIDRLRGILWDNDIDPDDPGEDRIPPLDPETVYPSLKEWLLAIEEWVHRKEGAQVLACDSPYHQALGASAFVIHHGDEEESQNFYLPIRHLSEGVRDAPYLTLHGRQDLMQAITEGKTPSEWVPE